MKYLFIFILFSLNTGCPRDKRTLPETTHNCDELLNNLNQALAKYQRVQGAEEQSIYSFPLNFGDDDEELVSDLLRYASNQSITSLESEEAKDEYTAALNEFNKHCEMSLIQKGTPSP